VVTSYEISSYRFCVGSNQMKNAAADYLLWPRPVLPPMLAERIRRHYHALYRNRFSSANAFARFWSEFIADDAFREGIETKARELQPIVFDSRDPSWGLWPIDPEECTAIGFLLGLSLEESLNDYLAGLPESRLVRLDQEIADSGRTLEEIFIEMLVESKAIAAHPADWSTGGER
jgi:hypothetical protein